MCRHQIREGAGRSTGAQLWLPVSMFMETAVAMFQSAKSVTFCSQQRGSNGCQSAATVTSPSRWRGWTHEHRRQLRLRHATLVHHLHQLREVVRHPPALADLCLRVGRRHVVGLLRERVRRALADGVGCPGEPPVAGLRRLDGAGVIALLPGPDTWAPRDVSQTIDELIRAAQPNC